MTQVLEYITQNYTLFLFSAIIILLAVIGYYAEKTNFGQGKVDKTKEEGKISDKKDLNHTGLLDIVNGSENSGENLVENKNNTDNKNESIQNTPTGESENNAELVIENKETVNPIIDVINSELNLADNSVIYNAEEIKNEEDKEKKSEEEFNKFSDEFDAILPKREVISDDLLSEIDDLELGKTQKFSLKELKNFDDIQLPRISDTVTEEQDIWKF